MVATREIPVSMPPCRSPFYNDLGGEGDYYYNARWYDAETGRFISEDPARDGQNWYTYVTNNPLKFVDPTGMRRVDGDDVGDDPSPKPDDDDDKDNDDDENKGKGKKETKTEDSYQSNGSVMDRSTVPDSTSEVLGDLDLFEDGAGRPTEPLDQNDPALSGIDNMASSGCNFRSYQGVAESETGLNLTADEIAQAVNDLQSTPNLANPNEMAVGSDMTVNNPDQVMNDAFDRLGAGDTTATAGWGGNGRDPDYQNQLGTTANNNDHHRLLDSGGNLLNDPYSPDLPLTNTSTVNIWIH